jgi:superfamily II DNA/RNA helicase
VRRLLDRTPTAGQRLPFSATLDDAVAGLAHRYLRDPATHSVGPPKASPARLDRHLFVVDGGHKPAVVAELASGAERTLLFTRAKHGAGKDMIRRRTTTPVPGPPRTIGLASQRERV